MNKSDLHKYQQRTANFIAQHSKCIISVDMGLGKTASVLAWLDWFDAFSGYKRKGLIIAPKRVAENNWQQEAFKWEMQRLADSMVIVKGTPKKRAEAIADEKHPIKILSRDNLKDVQGMEFDFLVLDELTSFKNVDASRTKAVLSIKSPIRIGLTGTFLANGAIDIYGQAAAVGLDFGCRSFYAWRGEYFRDALAGSGLAFHKWTLRVPLETLLLPIRDNIFTLTAGDYLSIPPVTETTHKVEVGDEIRQAIDGLDAFLAMELNGKVLAFDEKQKFAKLQTLCNGFVYMSDENGEILPKRGSHSAKLEAVADFVADCKDQNEPVLLFYAFQEEEAWLVELLKARGVRVGSVRDRNFMQKWNEHDYDCLMAHPASAGHGLNLQHGGRVIVWSTLTYNYEYFAQGNARLARQGQSGNVQIHYFVADRTCEERAVLALQKKHAEQSKFLTLTKQ